MIKIITDSTADLSPELLARFDITVVPLYVCFREQVYRDGVDLSAREFLSRVATSADFPRTAQPTPADFENVFRPLLDAGHELIYIGISSDLSGTIASAELACEQMGRPPVEIVDSRNLSMGIGLLAIEAAKLVQCGLTRQAIAGAIQEMTPRVRTAFVVDTLEFLHKGGRLTTLQALVGGILNMHPLIAVEQGRLVAAEKIRGNRRRALDRIYEFCLPDPARARPGMISVTHCACRADAETLAAAIKRDIPVAEVVITEAGSVIASHCGPNTVGILYIAA